MPARKPSQRRHSSDNSDDSSEMGSDDDDEDESDNSDSAEEESGDADETHELRWREQLTERALARFRQPPNIMDLVYGDMPIDKLTDMLQRGSLDDSEQDSMATDHADGSYNDNGTSTLCPAPTIFIC